MDDNFFDIGGGTSAPSAKLTGLNDFVVGTVLETYKKDFTVFGSKDPQIITDPNTGQPRKRVQLVAILQTDLRNWQGVSKVPLVDPNDPSKGEKPASEDDGTRAIYIPEMSKGNGHNGLIFAISQAVREAKTGGLPVGAKVAIKIVELKDVDKGNPLKVYAAQIQPPAPGGDMFAQAAPAQASPMASGSSFGGGDRGLNPPAQAPVAAAAPPQAPPQAAPPVQQDPWGTPATSSAPPF